MEFDKVDDLFSEEELILIAIQIIDSDQWVKVLEGFFGVYPYVIDPSLGFV